jgi:hypothetical protein
MNTFYIAENLNLVLSLIVLVWGMVRLIKIVGSASSMLVNKVMIIMHVVAYLFIIVTNAPGFYYYELNAKTYRIWTTCDLVVYSVCSTILCLIVN